MDLSNFTEDDITCAWLLLNSRLAVADIRINKNCVENFQYPLNVIVKMAVVYDIHIDNAKYIKEYNDVYNAMEEVLSIYEEWFDSLSNLSKDIIITSYRDNKPLSSLLDKINIGIINEARLSSIENKMLYNLKKLLYDKLTIFIDSYLINKDMINDDARQFLETDIWFVIYEKDMCILLNSEGFNTAGDIYLKDTDKDYLTNIIKYAKAEIHHALTRILSRKEYSESIVTRIKEKYIDMSSKNPHLF